jgi:hypothetical protein
MRTRIALVAIIPIALITAALLTLAALAQPARASIEAPPVASTHQSDQLTAFVRSYPSATMTMATRTTQASIAVATLPDLHKVIALLTMLPVATVAVAPVTPPAPAPTPVVTETVTPAQRAAWNRVAMCEEGGNWQADGSRFSGGLGISRANWSIYGGLQYAPSGAQATPDQQIMVARRIQYSPPDQYGCASW